MGAHKLVGARGFLAEWRGVKYCECLNCELLSVRDRATYSAAREKVEWWTGDIGVSGEGRGEQRLNNGGESWELCRERFPGPANSKCRD